MPDRAWCVLADLAADRYRAVGPWRGDEEQAERDAEHAERWEGPAALYQHLAELGVTPEQAAAGVRTAVIATVQKRGAPRVPPVEEPMDNFAGVRQRFAEGSTVKPSSDANALPVRFVFVDAYPAVMRAAAQLDEMADQIEDLAKEPSDG